MGKRTHNLLIYISYISRIMDFLSLSLQGWEPLAASRGPDRQPGPASVPVLPSLLGTIGPRAGTESSICICVSGAAHAG